MVDFTVINIEQVKQQSKSVGQAYLRGKTEALEELFAEIESEGYETINQIKGSIHYSIDMLNEMKKENNK